MRYKVAGAALAVVITLGACQDDGPETSTLTKAEFLKEADAVCADFAGQLAARIEPPSGSTDLPEIAESTTAVSTEEVGGAAEDTSIRDEVLSLASSYEDVVNDIRAIGFPEDEADELDRLFGELESAIDELATKAEDIDPAAGPEGLITVSATVQKVTEALSTLRAYGFDQCANA